FTTGSPRGRWRGAALALGLPFAVPASVEFRGFLPGRTAARARTSGTFPRPDRCGIDRLVESDRPAKDAQRSPHRSLPSFKFAHERPPGSLRRGASGSTYPWRRADAEVALAGSCTDRAFRTGT